MVMCAHYHSHITVRLDRKRAARLARWARSRKVPKSDVIRGAGCAERAAHEIDHVSHDVPMRQWVLRLPYRLRDRKCLLYACRCLTIVEYITKTVAICASSEEIPRIIRSTS